MSSPFDPPPGSPPPGMPPRAPLPPHSTLSVIALVMAVVGFTIGLIPFAGLLGTVGLFLAAVDLSTHDMPDRPQRHTLSKIGLVLGSLSTLGALVWLGIFTWGMSSTRSGSCPHLYAHDGEGYKLDADLASGALYRGAEREDTDRLEELKEVEGEYRVRLQNDLEEVDHIDSLSLLITDAPEGVEVLPTQDNELLALRGAAAPVSASDGRGADARAELSAADGRGVTGEAATGERGGEPVTTWELSFDRPAGRRAALVVRGRTTDFAERAFVRYMAEMGQGVRPLLEMRAGASDGCDCYRRYMEEEIERMGLALEVTAGGERVALRPVGPAVLRSQAVPIALPGGEGPVVVRLSATPRFWEIDQVALAEVDEARPEVSELWPKAAAGEALELLSRGDGRRVVLGPGERVDVSFEAPPLAAGKVRTATARLRGYYDLDIGGQAWVDPSRLVAHRLGWVSLPRYARGLGAR